MPFDHIVLNAVLMTLLVCIGILLGKDKKACRLFLVIACAIGICGFLLSHYPNLLVAIFPFANIIFYSNWYAFAAALFILPAINLSTDKFQKTRIAILCTVLIAVSLAPFKYFWVEEAERGEGFMDSHGICRQTSIETCGAASACTLLHLYHIEVTEPEIVSLALTKERRGTHPLGLYPALKLLTADRIDLNVRLRRMSFENLMDLNRPAIIMVGISKSPETAMEKAMVIDYNWTPGTVHNVVFLGVDENEPTRVKIGEPEYGFERWRTGELQLLFKDIAVYITSP